DSGGVDTLTLSGQFQTVNWSTGISGDTLFVPDSGTYSVSVKDSNGCSATASITIARDPRPPFIVLSLDTIQGGSCDRIVIPIRIDTSFNMIGSGATDFTMTITFDQSLLVPVDKTIPSVIKGRWRTLTISGLRPDDLV